MNSNLETVEPLTSPTVVLCIGFTGIYLLFLITISMLHAPLQQMFYSISHFRDSSLILAIIFYFGLVFLFFSLLGMYYYYKINTIMKKQVYAIIPLSLFGVIFWSFLFYRMLEFNGQFGDFSWLLYEITILWATPAIEPLRLYFSKGNTLVYIALLPSILPGIAFICGSWAAKKFKGMQILRATIGTSVISILLLGISAVWPQSNQFTFETYPKIDGATAAIPLGQLLMWELTDATVAKAKERVQFNKSHQAYVNLINKEVDLIFVSGPSEQELEFAAAKNVELNLTAIGRDAFIFLVHKDNPVDTLTIEEIRDIYTAKINNWKQLGGSDHEIIAFQRNENSGSQTFMETQIMGSSPLMKPPVNQQIGGMGGLIETVAEYKNANNSIGYSFHYFASEMHKNENVKFVSIEGVEATRENILNETYPLTATLYAVTRKDQPADSAAIELLNWILSQEGSKLLEKGGLIPVNEGGSK